MAFLTPAALSLLLTSATDAASLVLGFSWGEGVGVPCGFDRGVELDGGVPRFCVANMLSSGGVPGLNTSIISARAKRPPAAMIALMKSLLSIMIRISFCLC